MKKRSLKKYTGGGQTALVDKFGNPTPLAGMAGAGAMGAVNILSAEGGEDRGEAIGSTIGNVGGQALNFLVPGLGAIAGPILGKLGGLAGRAIGDKMDDGPEKAAAKAKLDAETVNRYNRNNTVTSDKTYQTNSFTFAYGGEVPEPNAELELNEQFQMPDGQVGEVDGPSHAEGGVETALPEGTRIYSDRLKHNGRTFAKTVKPINSKIAKLEKQLETDPNDKLKQNSITLMNQQLDHYFNEQEELKQNNEMKRSIKYAKGGTIPKYWGGGTNDGIANPWNNPELAAKEEAANMLAARQGGVPYTNRGITEQSGLPYENTPFNTSKTGYANSTLALKPYAIPAGPDTMTPTPYGRPSPLLENPAVNVGTRQPRTNTGFQLDTNNLENSKTGPNYLNPEDAPSKTNKFGNFVGNNAGTIGQIGTAALTAGLQNRNLNKLKAPRSLSNVNLTSKLGNPNLVDYSAQRNAIDQGYLASADSAQRNLSNSATAQAFKNQANLARLKGTGESWQNQSNTNTQIENQFLNQRNEAGMRESMINNEVDKYNLENKYNYDAFKTGQKGAILGQLGNVGSQVFGNMTNYKKQLDQANILANTKEQTVVRDMLRGNRTLADNALKTKKITQKQYDEIADTFANGGTVGKVNLINTYKDGGTVKKRSMKKAC